jgi:hypothetical protein
MTRRGGGRGRGVTLKSTRLLDARVDPVEEGDRGGDVGAAGAGRGGTGWGPQKRNLCGPEGLPRPTTELVVFDVRSPSQGLGLSTPKVPTDHILRKAHLPSALCSVFCSISLRVGCSR